MQGDTPPLVSIVVCTRNRGQQLTGTLDSIRTMESALPWEAVIVDNASTDDTADVIHAAAQKDGRIRYLRVDRIGLGAGRDAAWRAARGAIICFTDDDCYLKPDYVDKIAAAFAEFPEVGCIGGRILLHDPDDAPVTINESMEPISIPARRFVAAGVLHGANLSFRRDALEASGGFDPQLGAGTPFPAEDIDALAAVIWSGRPARYDPRPTVSHHHGRKAADIPRLFIGYDAGRGAYWAKYILRRDTRWIYARQWWETNRSHKGKFVIRRVVNEMKSAYGYMRKQGRMDAVLLSFPFASAALAYLFARENIRQWLRPRAGT